jgi:lytic murein transglycosylase
MKVFDVRAVLTATCLAGALGTSGAQAGNTGLPPKTETATGPSIARILTPSRSAAFTKIAQNDVIQTPRRRRPAAAAPAAAPPPAAPEHAAKRRRSSTKGLPPKAAPANCKNKGRFDRWLAEFRREAAAEGISRRAISSALDGVTLDRTVISRDRRQGFFSQSFASFYKKLATRNRLRSGKAQIRKNKVAFDRVKKQYGVPAAVITGFWALESDFGAGMGKLPILRSLATLAYDCRRGPMFREELKAALKIIDRGDIAASRMVGSWAGEIGQTQFLPTRYLEHAIDYDGDGRANLFRNPTDIIGTTANYMNYLGWKRGQPWLEEVRVPRKMAWAQADLTILHPRSKWAAWGVKRANGRALPNDSLPASLLLPMGHRGPAFLAYENFGVYLQWNQSLNYATTAAHLAARIAGAPALRPISPDIPVLGERAAKELQRRLVKRGYNVGEIDGKIGLNTRKSVKEVQKKLGFPADSYPTPRLLNALRQGA